MSADDCGPDCRQALAKLEAYLDGELPDSDLASIRGHLSDCYPCTDRASFEGQLRAIVRRGCVEDPPASLMDRIRERLDRVGATGA